MPCWYLSSQHVEQIKNIKFGEPWREKVWTSNPTGVMPLVMPLSPD
jgi:hypothetical protein